MHDGEAQRRESSEEANNFQVKRFRDNAFNLIFENKIGYVQTGTGNLGCTLHREQVSENTQGRRV